MNDRSESRPFIEAMAKHLPPSGTDLRLLDVNGAAASVLSETRADLAVIPVAGTDWDVAPGSVDAIAAYNVALSDQFLQAAMKALRPGGRLIVVNPDAEVDRMLVNLLENAGYTRILVQPAVESAASAGVLVRGEKPHSTLDTLARIRQTANLDESALDIAAFKGHYLHLLVRQMPNKPVWMLDVDERVEWEAVALDSDEGPVLLAFSSLPKAVAFMQPAVLSGQIKDVNKVSKFRRQTLEEMGWSVLLNSSIDDLSGRTFLLVSIDPNVAEAPDE